LCCGDIISEAVCYVAVDDDDNDDGGDSDGGSGCIGDDGVGNF